MKREIIVSWKGGTSVWSVPCVNPKRTTVHYSKWNTIKGSSSLMTFQTNFELSYFLSQKEKHLDQRCNWRHLFQFPLETCLFATPLFPRPFISSLCLCTGCAYQARHLKAPQCLQYSRLIVAVWGMSWGDSHGQTYLETTSNKKTASLEIRGCKCAARSDQGKRRVHSDSQRRDQKECLGNVRTMSRPPAGEDAETPADGGCSHRRRKAWKQMLPFKRVLNVPDMRRGLW